MSIENISESKNSSWSKFKWNSSADDTTSFETFMTLPGIKATFITLYVIVLIVSLIGNGMVIFSVVRVKSLQTVRNLFILNLAVTDILMAILAGPITPLSFYLKSWIFGEFLCSLFPLCFGTFAHVSTFTCTAIAVHRYAQIVMPSGRQMSKKVCFLTSFVIWILAISIGIPLAVYAEIFTYKEYSFCIENWPSLDDRKVYSLTDLFIQFVIPCVIITFCYVRVWQSIGKYDGLVASYLQLEESDVTEIRQANKMLVLMVVVFVICWLPMNIIILIFEFVPEIFTFTAIDVIYFIAHIMAMSSTALNPIIYAGMDKGFQKQFKKIFSPFLVLTRMRSRIKTQFSAEPEIKENDTIKYATDDDNIKIVANNHVNTSVR